MQIFLHLQRFYGVGFYLQIFRVTLFEKFQQAQQTLTELDRLLALLHNILGHGFSSITDFTLCSF